MKLDIKLIPRGVIVNNVKRAVKSEDWKKIARRACSRANKRCEVCGKRTEKIICNERWTFYKGSIILLGFEGLCENCYMVKHINRAYLSGDYNTAKKHFMTVNNLKPKEAEEKINKAFKLWNDRSAKTWEIDLSKLKQYGITIKY